MEFKYGGSETNQKTVLGHPSGLFVLFFTEMWERFSYYGMRALLVLFLTSSLLNEGWGWERADATILYGWYIGLVYLTPIIGGYIADKFLGFRNAVILGAFIMTLGHASMALEGTTHWFFYAGLTLLIIGNGLFKPNISSIVGQLYKTQGEEKDAGYTIFYMGINAGSFLGILLCGYLGEKIGWHYGFGLAGVFMFIGMVQFYLAQKIFGKIGLKPNTNKSIEKTIEDDAEKLEDNVEELVEGVSKSRIISDRMIVIGIFALFTTFFWWAFEQAGGSMTIFAGDYTQRVLEGSSATAFKIINSVIVIIPLGIITYVLSLLFKKTFSKYSTANIVLASSFVIVWALVIWMLQNDYKTTSYAVAYSDVNNVEKVKEIRTSDPLTVGDVINVKVNNKYEFYNPADSLNLANTVKDGNLLNEDKNAIGYFFNAKITDLKEESAKGLFWKDNTYASLAFENQKNEVLKQKLALSRDTTFTAGSVVQLKLTQNLGYVAEASEDTVTAKVTEVKSSQVEVSASWFSVLNSLFIIVFASLFSKIWQSKYNPSGPVKFALGLILVGVGFAALAYGSSGIPEGAKTASVSMVWLVLAYLFHTLGELCVSPVGLSYVSKLAPVKFVGIMFGIWFIANFLAGVIGGWTASYIDPISEKYGLSTFFLIFTLIPAGAGVIMLLLNGKIKKMMHGIK
ncbi:peptide transporter [Cellulophaga lytica]|uniref:peptide MFS transporter n=1 Tax=Cellulophaga lytica TaxID=979 RepID=UPI000950B1FA|nr:oligopeptide:H+ symporter [Cellulophaga lytica]APU09537.1 peptide transporter [Cellulophaga lytica]